MQEYKIERVFYFLVDKTPFLWYNMVTTKEKTSLLETNSEGDIFAVQTEHMFFFDGLFFATHIEQKFYITYNKAKQEVKMQDINVKKDGGFDIASHRTLCAQCGYRIVRGDIALRVHMTGDMIHKECWQYYTEDNLFVLCEEYDV